MTWGAGAKPLGTDSDGNGRAIAMEKTLGRQLRLALCMALFAGLSCGPSNRLADVSKVSVYSTEWSLTTIKTMTCDDLKVEGPDTIIVEADRVGEFATALREAKLKEMPDYHDLDVRICCVLEDASGAEIIRVSFSPTSQMQIDDKVYETDQALFRVVLSFLPPKYLAT